MEGTSMTKVGAQRAAELTGVSKSTIQRAMKTGKLSYHVDDNDRRVIDMSELERAFGLRPQNNADRASAGAVEAEAERAAQMLETERMKMRIRMLEDQLESARSQIDDLRNQRDLWQKQAQQVLLTSQYSQKQAEELKEKLDQREREAQARRQQMQMQQEQRRQQTVPAQPSSQGAPQRSTMQGATQQQVAPRSETRPEARPETRTETRVEADQSKTSRGLNIPGFLGRLRGNAKTGVSQPAAAPATQEGPKASEVAKAATPQTATTGASGTTDAPTGTTEGRRGQAA